MTISSIIMSDVVSLRSRGLWQGATNLLFGLGSGLGGALGGLVSDRFGWYALQHIFSPYQRLHH
jgi:MFS family permease